MNNLSTSIATTRSQAERLLAIGINPETADMQYYRNAQGTWRLYANFEGCKWTDFRTPMWSLSRLISMLPTYIPDPKGCTPYHPELIKDNEGYVISIMRSTADCLVGTHIEDDPIECWISIIGWLIDNNYFNKDYLK